MSCSWFLVQELAVSNRFKMKSSHIFVFGISEAKIKSKFGPFRIDDQHTHTTFMHAFSGMDDDAMDFLKWI